MIYRILIFNTIFCFPSFFFICLLNILFTYTYISHLIFLYPLTHSFTHSFTHSPHSLTLSFTHLLTHIHSLLLTRSLTLTHLLLLPPSLTLLRRRGTWYSARGRIYALTFLDLTHTILFDKFYIPKYYLIYHDFTSHTLKSIYLYLHIFILLSPNLRSDENNITSHTHIHIYITSASTLDILQITS